MQCQYCGKTIKDGSIFCPSCGEKIEGISVFIEKGKDEIESEGRIAVSDTYPSDDTFVTPEDNEMNSNAPKKIRSLRNVKQKQKKVRFF